MANITNANIEFINVQDRISNPTDTPASGFAYIFTKSGGLYIKLDDTTVVGPFGTSGVSSLNDLSDVDTATSPPVGGELLSYDGVEWIPVVASPTKGDLVAYNGTGWVKQSVGANGSVLTADSGQSTGLSWSATGPSQVLISANDTTADYLENQIVAGSNVTITTLNDGADESLQISASGTDTLVSADDTTAGYLEDKIVAGSNVTITTLNPGANETLQISASASAGAETVSVSANDTTPDYLGTKLVAGSGITLTENNDGANETLTVTATGSSGALNDLSNVSVPSPANRHVLTYNGFGTWNAQYNKGVARFTASAQYIPGSSTTTLLTISNTGAQYFGDFSSSQISANNYFQWDAGTFPIVLRSTLVWQQDTATYSTGGPVSYAFRFKGVTPPGTSFGSASIDKPTFYYDGSGATLSVLGGGVETVTLYLSANTEMTWEVLNDGGSDAGIDFELTYEVVAFIV